MTTMLRMKSKINKVFGNVSPFRSFLPNKTTGVGNSSGPAGYLERGWVIANHKLVSFHAAFISSVLSLPAATLATIAAAEGANNLRC